MCICHCMDSFCITSSIFNVPFVYSDTLHNACAVTDYYGSTKAEPRVCQYCHGIFLRWAPDFNNPPDHPDCFKHFKTTGEYYDCHGSPRSCHGLAKDRQGFVTVSLYTVLHGCPRIDDPGDPASEPGQWD